MKNDDTGKQIARILFTILFAIVYFIFLNVSMLLIIVKLSLTSDLFKDIFNYASNSYSMVEENTLAYVSPYEEKIPSEVGTYVEENPDAAEDLEKTLEETLNKYDIPSDIFEYVDEDDEEEVLDLASEVINGFVNYTVGTTNDVYFPKKDIEKVLQNTIENYERKTGNKIDTSRLGDLLDELESEYVSFVEENTDTDVRNFLNSILNGFVFYITIAIAIFSFIMLIALNFKSKKTYGLLGALHIGVAVTYYSIASVIETQFEEAKAVYTLLQNVMKVSYVVFGVGIVGILIFAIFEIKERKGAKIHA